VQIPPSLFLATTEHPSDNRRTKEANFEIDLQLPSLL